MRWRGRQSMNSKWLGENFPATFDARSADLTGLKMRRITRDVSFDHLVSAWRSDPGIAGPSALGMVRSMTTNSAVRLCGMHSLLSARRPAPLAEPGAVIRHLRALRRRRVPLARRRLGAVVVCAPAQLDTVVQVVRHLEIRGAVEHILERERPGGAVAARI